MLTAVSEQVISISYPAVGVMDLPVVLRVVAEEFYTPFGLHAEAVEEGGVLYPLYASPGGQGLFGSDIDSLQVVPNKQS